MPHLGRRRRRSGLKAALRPAGEGGVDREHAFANRIVPARFGGRGRPRLRPSGCHPTGGGVHPRQRLAGGDARAPRHAAKTCRTPRWRTLVDKPQSEVYNSSVQANRLYLRVEADRTKGGHLEI